MNFDPTGTIEKLKRWFAMKSVEKAKEAVRQTNLLLKLLQDAGYQIGELDVALGVPPTITIQLKTGPLTSDSRLEGVLQANKDNDVLALVLGSLIHANKLRDMVNVDTLEFKDAKIVLKASPSISFQWKEKGAAKAAMAS